MSLSFRAKSFLRNRRWKKYWVNQDGKNHAEFYRKLAAEWRAERAGNPESGLPKTQYAERISTESDPHTNQSM
jgi:hypothetical protein